MIILSLETSSLHGSIAAYKDDQLIEYVKLSDQQRTAQSLAPAVAQLLRHVGWQPTDVELIAVTTGPGSFTGLRVGVTMAKTFAYATGAEVIGVNTLDVIAHQVPEQYDEFTCALDAHRGQLFRKSYQRTTDGLVGSSDTEIVEVDDFIAELQPGFIATGPMFAKLESRLNPQVELIDKKLWEPTAATVGQIGFEQFQQRGPDDLWGLVPQYFRKSAAEEKADASTS